MNGRATGPRALRALVGVLLIFSWMLNPLVYAATNFHGTVTFNGLPVPGALVTASQGDQKKVAVTDDQGNYIFSDLADGAWHFQVDMSGFAEQSQDVTVSADAAGPTWDLKLLPLADIMHGAAPVVASSASPANVPAGTTPAGTSNAASNGNAPAPANASKSPPANGGNAQANSQANAPVAPAAPSSDTSNDLQQSAATGLVVNGSVNNGAASAFAQSAAFGNNRRGPGSLYNGGFGLTFDTSAWDARPYAQIVVPGLTPAKPSYNNVTLLGSFGGPIGIPHHLVPSSNFFVGYQHSTTSNSSTATGNVPTTAERGGDLSAITQPIYNPATNTPFSGNKLPAVNAQAAALLNLYPSPSLPGNLGYNFEHAGVSASQTDAMQARLSKSIKNKNQLLGTFGLQRQSTQSDTNLFAYRDGSHTQGLDVTANWQRFYRPGGIGFFTTNFKYEFNRQATSQNPFFANLTNVSGLAGILGNDQTPVNWGPPTLSFNSIPSLNDANWARNATDTQTFSYQSLWYRGKHTVQFGADLLRLQFNSNSQQNPRGTFSFTGVATQQIVSGKPVEGTGSDLADFLLGIPDSATIAFGNADKYLRGWREDAYVTDDWRLRAGLTVDVGVRWEFASPMTEIKNRLANIDEMSNFNSVGSVTATNPTGTATGAKYPSSLVHSDFRGVEPRLAVAWRPRSNSPLVVRAGYGVYDNTSVYQAIATQMAQQPPFSKTFDLTNSSANQLSLATAFQNPGNGLPTFGVDPNFRVGYAQVWNASVQQDLPGSLVMIATYTGTRGSHLIQEFLPNAVPGTAGTPPVSPPNFVFLTSNATSSREAGSLQLRRRLRDGFTATVQYTYAKATDDASTFSGAAIGSGSGAGSSPGGGGGSVSVAQNWRNLTGERGRSSFDQRHLVTLSAQYTTGEGLRAGALMSGWKGTFLKDWTFTESLTVGSGLPLNPVYDTVTTGIGVPWIIRPDATGISATANLQPGHHLNAQAYAAPANTFGDAPRNSITGPAQFGLNASFNRTFRLGSRVDATWETDASNVLNHVTYSSWNTNIQGPTFGAAAGPNAMRKLSTTIRVRF